VYAQQGKMNVRMVKCTVNAQ